MFRGAVAVPYYHKKKKLCHRVSKTNLQSYVRKWFDQNQNYERKTDLCRLDDFTKGSTFKIPCLILTKTTFKLINQTMGLQNPFPLSHIPTREKKVSIYPENESYKTGKKKRERNSITCSTIKGLNKQLNTYLISIIFTNYLRKFIFIN